MVALSRYWTLWGITRLGQCKSVVQAAAKAFLEQSFPEPSSQARESDSVLQTQLWVHHSASIDASPRATAELCLRCFISHGIYQACLQRVQRYGGKHNFTLADLLPLVLDGLDRGPPDRNALPASYKSLTTQILETYNPEKSQLSTWTALMVKSHKELKRFLLEHGIEEVSDWSILNQRTPGGLERILSQYFERTPLEVEASVRLLEAYHQVYRNPLQHQRRAQGKFGPYPQPDQSQLEQIAQRLSQPKLPPEETLKQLKALAQLLRIYRSRMSEQQASPLKGGTCCQQATSIYRGALLLQ